MIRRASLLISLSTIFAVLATEACSGHDADVGGGAPQSVETADSVAGRKFLEGSLGLPAEAEANPSPERVRYRAVVAYIADELERENPGTLARLGADLASGDGDRIVQSLDAVQASTQSISESAALRERVQIDPLFASDVNAQTFDVVLAPQNTGGSPPRSGSGGQGSGSGGSGGGLGKGADGKFGDDRQGPSGAVKDLADLGKPSDVGKRLGDLKAIDQGTSTPKPDSRLGAYAATKGYPPGTVGDGVHNAIGTIYGALGNYGEENIGRVFNSPDAKALYNQPVDSPAGRQMAELEYGYWNDVKTEDPYSAGGRLGSAFNPAARDFLQRNVFSSKK